MWINYQQLQYFREIAKAGSISLAAKKLLVSNPALSMQLKKLEENLGQKLFLRQKKKLILTDFGSYVLEYAEKIFTTGEELLSNINNHFNDRKISIGINSGLPKAITTKIVTFILKHHEGTKVQITEGDDTKLIKDLKTRDCDLIISNSFISSQQDQIKSTFLFGSPLAFYGTKKFKKLHKNFPRSLEGVPIILPSLHSNLRLLIDEWYLKNQIHYQVVIEIHDSASKKFIALEDTGIVVLPELGAEHFVASGDLIKIGDLSISEEYYASFRHDELVPNQVVNDIIEFLTVKN